MCLRRPDMERLSSHVSTAKATFSGRSACPVQDSNVTHRNANRQHIRGLQKALRDRLQPESPAAILRLCSHANAHARKGKGSGSRATSTCAALAEPPLEVLEETFPRGNNWEVTVLTHTICHFHASQGALCFMHSSLMINNVDQV